jgi:hypothetical protein
MFEEFERTSHPEIWEESMSGRGIAFAKILW